MTPEEIDRAFETLDPQLTEKETRALAALVAEAREASRLRTDLEEARAELHESNRALLVACERLGVTCAFDLLEEDE